MLAAFLGHRNGPLECGTNELPARKSAPILVGASDDLRRVRRPLGNRVRLALDLLRHHRGGAAGHGRHRGGVAGNAARAGTGPGPRFSAATSGLFGSRAFVGYMLCQVLASQIIFTFAGAGPYIVVTQMGRSSAEYGAWFATTGFAYLIGNLFCVRFAPGRRSRADLVRPCAAAGRRVVESAGGSRASISCRRGCSARRCC